MKTVKVSEEMKAACKNCREMCPAFGGKPSACAKARIMMSTEMINKPKRGLHHGVKSGR